MKRYLYFGEATVATTGEACMFSVDTFLGMTPRAATQTKMHFQARNGTLADDDVLITHTGYTTKQFMTEMAGFMQANQRNPFLVVADKTNPGAVTKMITVAAVTTVA